MQIRPDELSSIDRYRWLVHSVVPRPIAWVSTLSASGVANLAPFSWFNGVSARPPIVSIAVGPLRDGRSKDTRANLDHCPELVISVVTEELAEPMNLTAGEWPAEQSEFEVAGLEAVPSEIVRPPRPARSPLALECRVERVVEVGSPPTSLVLAEVLLIHAAEEILSDGLPDAAKLKPLARLGGKQYARLGELFEMERPRVS